MYQSTTPADSERGPAYAEILEARFAVLSDREQQILIRRTLSEEPETLEHLGKTMDGVTRERVRQLETRAVKGLAGETSRTAGPPPQAAAASAAGTHPGAPAACAVLEALEALRRLPLPVTDARLVAAGFAPLDSLATRMLLELARRQHVFGDRRLATADFGGFRWLYVGDDDPATLTTAVIGELAGDGVVDDPVELWDALEQRLQPHTGSSAAAADLAGDLVDDLGAVEVSGRYALLGGQLGVIEQLTRVLRAHGGPMTVEALLTHLPGRNRRTVENALLKPPFMRVTRHAFNLAEAPGATRHRTLRQVIYDEIAERGQVSVQHLQELAEKHGHSRASIAFYGWLPGLIEDGGVLRPRRPSDPSPAGDPALDDQCFRISAGAHRGRWSYTTTVDHSRLRGGSLVLPPPLVALLGIEPGATREVLKVNGTHTVRASWRHGPYLFSRDLKAVLTDLGLGDGDRMRLTEVGPGELLIERVPELTGAGGPYRTLAAGAGLYDDTGAQVTEGDIDQALAYAVGLDPHAPLIAVERRLRSRRNADLADALALLFPEQLAG